MIEHFGKSYRIEVCTPAGREKYLSIFKKYIYAEMERGVVDGWQLWQNTLKDSDIKYLASMEAENPKVKRFFIHNLEDRYQNTDTMRTNEFFANAQRDDTIYIRFDDDIVWYEPGAIEKIAIARIEHPDAFIIYPNVINSTLVTSWHQKSGALGTEAGTVRQEKHGDPDYAYLDEFSYTDSKFIDYIHNTFQRRYAEGSLNAYYLPSRMLTNGERFSICSIAWWGKDHLAPGPIEEPQLSWEMPELLNKQNFFVGDALMVHFAYHTQRDYLESQNPNKLDFYKELANKYVAI